MGSSRIETHGTVNAQCVVSDSGSSISNLATTINYTSNLGKNNERTGSTTSGKGTEYWSISSQDTRDTGTYYASCSAIDRAGQTGYGTTLPITVYSGGKATVITEKEEGVTIAGQKIDIKNLNQQQKTFV